MVKQSVNFSKNQVLRFKLLKNQLKEQIFVMYSLRASMIDILKLKKLLSKLFETIESQTIQ
jgi:hypothetical protein